MNVVGSGPRGFLVGLSALVSGAVMMVHLTIPWLVLQNTGSPVRAALGVAVELAAFAASCLLGAPLAERVGHRAIIVVSGLLSAGAVLAIPLLQLGFWPMLMALALFGLVRAPGQNTVMADLASVSGQLAMADEYGRHLCQVCGMVLAGVLIAEYGSSTALTVAATTIAVVMILVALLMPVLPNVTSGLSYGESLRQMVAVPGGSNPVTTTLVMLALGIGLVDVFVLLPVYANDVLHSPAALGLMAGTMAACILVGSALHDWLGPITSVGLFSVFILVGNARFGVLAIQPSLTLVLIAMAVAGLVAGPTEQEPSLSRYARIPPSVRALVIGAGTGKLSALGPLCLLLGGVAVASIGLTASLWVVAGLAVVLTFGSGLVDP